MVTKQKVKKYELDAEEAAILKDFETGKLRKLPKQAKQEEILRIQGYLHAKHNKTKRVNIRMTEQDYLYAQAKALEEGLPYQTLLSSILHKYFSGYLVEGR